LTSWVIVDLITRSNRNTNVCSLLLTYWFLELLTMRALGMVGRAFQWPKVIKAMSSNFLSAIWNQESAKLLSWRLELCPCDNR